MVLRVYYYNIYGIVSVLLEYIWYYECIDGVLLGYILWYYKCINRIYTSVLLEYIWYYECIIRIYRIYMSVLLEYIWYYSIIYVPAVKQPAHPLPVASYLTTSNQ